MKLTETRILKLTCPPGKKDVLVSDDELRGLYIRVSASAIEGKAGGRSFLCQYSYTGQKRRVPLGDLTLARARSEAVKIMGAVASGLDPVADRKATKAEARRKAAHVELTLEALVEQWEALALAGKRKSYSHEAVRALRRAFAAQLPMPAAALDRATVVRALDKLTAAGSPVMARQTARYGSAAFSWAMKRGSIAANPFTGIPLAPRVTRERVLSDDELRAVWQATAGPGSFNSIVRTLMLTGQRLTEVSEMARAELSDDLTAWTLPGARVKNGVAHVVPLSAQARAIIEAAPRYANNPLVFAGLRGPFNGWGSSKDRLDRDSGVADWTLHDLRRTCATNLQKLGIRLEVTESILNHISGSRSGITGVYQRYSWADEKRAALNVWGERLQAIVEGREAARNVVALRA